MKRIFFKAGVAALTISFSLPALADGDFSWRWLSETVGAPFAAAVGSAEEHAKSLVGSDSEPAKLDLAALERAGRQPCSEMPFPPGATMDPGFSPEGSSEQKVLRAFHEAASGPGERSLLVIGYEFTSYPVAKAIVAAKESGARVAVLLDPKENIKRSSKISYLLAHGVPVREDHRRQMIHDKVAIVNGATIEIGSFNYTAAAASSEHAENALIIRRAPNIAECYTGHFKLLWDEATPVS